VSFNCDLTDLRLLTFTLTVTNGNHHTTVKLIGRAVAPYVDVKS